MEVPTVVDLCEDGHERYPVVHQRDMIADLQVLVAVERELMDDRAPIDDRVELDGDLVFRRSAAIRILAGQ